MNGELRLCRVYFLLSHLLRILLQLFWRYLAKLLSPLANAMSHTVVRTLMVEVPLHMHKIFINILSIIISIVKILAHIKHRR